MKRKILVKNIRKWLGQDGINFFRNVKHTHGRIDAIWMEGRMPHVVYWKEGRLARDFIKSQVNWSNTRIDTEWVGLIEEAIQVEDNKFYKVISNLFRKPVDNS